MKNAYAKPTLQRRERLSGVTAFAAASNQPDQNGDVISSD